MGKTWNCKYASHNWPYDWIVSLLPYLICTKPKVAWKIILSFDYLRVLCKSYHWNYEIILKKFFSCSSTTSRAPPSSLNRHNCTSKWPSLPTSARLASYNIFDTPKMPVRCRYCAHRLNKQYLISVVRSLSDMECVWCASMYSILLINYLI